jgi:hypothetical protein
LSSPPCRCKRAVSMGFWFILLFPVILWGQSPAPLYQIDHGHADVLPELNPKVRPFFWEIWLFQLGTKASGDINDPGHWGTVTGQTLQETKHNFYAVLEFQHDTESICQCGGSFYTADVSFGPVAFFGSHSDTQIRVDAMAMYDPIFHAFVDLRKLWTELQTAIEDGKKTLGQTAWEDLGKKVDDPAENARREFLASYFTILLMVQKDLLQAGRDLFDFDPAAQKRLQMELGSANIRMLITKNSRRRYMEAHAEAH